MIKSRVRFLGLELALFGVQLARREPSAPPGVAFHVRHVVRGWGFGSADMIDRGDTSPDRRLFVGGAESATTSTTPERATR